jgi:hypothetical protein
MIDDRSPRRPRIEQGNAADERRAGARGWFIGHFIESLQNEHAGSLRTSDEVEVKWGEHEPGEARRGPSVERAATTLTLLIGGRFRLTFPDLGREVLLERPADYVLFGPGIRHTWTALAPCTVVTVRWPSRMVD